MQAAAVNPLQTLNNLWTNFTHSDTTPSLIEVHIVDKNDIFYKKGRILAEKIYRKTWNTKNLIDGNDYAVVVTYKGKAIGNMNLQIRPEGKFLKSEVFFGREHWQGYYQFSGTKIAEVSALAISQDIPSELSRPVMMMLIMGIQSLCRLKSISLLATVQHEFLIRILKQSLHLPFIRNQEVKSPEGNLPDDDYWNRKDPPSLYYLNTSSRQAIDACASFFCYLNVTGINTVFISRIQTEKQTYSAFRKSWSSHEMSMELKLAV